MARVIRITKPKEQQVTCDCGAVVGYTRADVRETNRTDYGGGPAGSRWVTCPNCVNRIVLEEW